MGLGWEYFALYSSFHFIVLKNENVLQFPRRLLNKPQISRQPDAQNLPVNKNLSNFKLSIFLLVYSISKIIYTIIDINRESSFSEADMALSMLIFQIVHQSRCMLSLRILN